ncbi:MAG: filamentous hemagglutinin N-terminal domain-containing protein, partial [Betaproteobacteria bacterium]|nr:filamentous hemagglutinin N-terminal domain-containing protein [Betaproteobacteria bacterium]
MARKTTSAFPARRRLIVIAISACFSTAPAWSNPTAPQVVTGSASFAQKGNLLTVTNSNGAIINWKSFSIGASETTRFNQPSSASSVLNRVIANDPSVLLGTLSSNGKVWLVNPSGIMVGQGARIDVGGFVASTLAVRNEDFLAGRLNFQATPNAGNIENRGAITTPSGGSVYLVAPAVENRGIINAPGGEVILAAGQKVDLIDTGTPGVKVEITGNEGSATNLGQILSEAGRIGMAGVLVKNSGSLNASSVVREGGRIFLKASKDAYLDGSGTILATGAKGGSIDILGSRVAVMDNASLDASGQTGGGQIRVGGDYQGKNPEVRNAQITYFGPEASIRANATSEGDGGKVIVWADDTTRAYGTISAQGGPTSGNGGFVETSGYRYLDFQGRVDTSAPNGNVGTLFLDPENINISTSANFNISGSSPFQPQTIGTSTLNVTTLKNALVSGDVIIDTTGGGTGFGDISFSAALDFNGIGSKALTMNANRQINISGSITDSVAGGDTLNFVLNPGKGSAGATASISATSVEAGNLTVNTATGGSGNLIISGGTTKVSGALNVTSLAFTGGTLELNGASAADRTISLGSGSNWSWGAGTLRNAVFNIASGATLDLGGTVALDSTSLTNTGTVNVNTGFLDLKGTATLANSGAVNLSGGYDLRLYDTSSLTNAAGATIDLKADGSQLWVSNAYQSSSAPTITNHGNIVKSAGTGTSYLSQYYRNTYGSGTAYPDFLVSDGRISASTGTLQIEGNARYETGASFGAAGANGTGIYLYDGIQTVNASQTLDALRVNTSVTGTGSLSVANGGTMTWYGGTYSGAGLTVNSGGTLDLAGTLTMQGSPLSNAGTVNLNTGYLDLKGTAALANSGTVNLSGGYDLRLYDTTSLTNASGGTIDLKADGSYLWVSNAYQSASTPTITTHGNIVKSAGTGTSYLSQYYRNTYGSGTAYPDFLVSDGR